MPKCSFLKMCFWNIGGLKSKGMDKTKDILFMQSIEKYDLVFLAETHVGYDSGIKHIHVGKFLYHLKCRPVETFLYSWIQLVDNK
jgi:hypothetical protein